MTKTTLDAVPELSMQAEEQTSKSLKRLETSLQEKHRDICQWFDQQWEKSPSPVYGSVDLRHAGFKLAPVDMNLFPAGFNNLNSHFLTEAIQAAQETILAWVPQAKRIIVIPESHTRNFFYWENIAALVNILSSAGFLVKIGGLTEEVIGVVELPSGGQVQVQVLKRNADKVYIEDFIPDLILLNNDLSAGIPDILQQLQQPLFPPAELGWHQRLKSEYFRYYAEVSQEFAEFLDFDPWLLKPLFRYCGEIDFLHREGLDCLIEHTQSLLQEVQEKYREYGVLHQPFAIVKADAGTQGMAVMTVRSIDELRHLNRKQRTAMAKSKGGVPVRRVIVQEGVYTFETFGPQSYVAEPVIYLWGKRVVGGFYRIHQEKGPDENLNTPGMHFQSLPFAWHCGSWPKENVMQPYQKRLAIYGVIAQLSMLAAAREILAI